MLGQLGERLSDGSELLLESSLWRLDCRYRPGRLSNQLGSGEGMDCGDHSGDGENGPSL